MEEVELPLAGLLGGGMELIDPKKATLDLAEDFLLAEVALLAPDDGGVTDDFCDPVEIIGAQ
ncbi:hypothetical protein A3C37_02065 [Candidatus Peribacteria bacterium RIFCSPHIGHO2_02_FULL_53_20]|nr:MAG: hypothetical protein A3C37_02065 [Candidatus Peribacteria bacterium RIFCSPHIGHO2_02_FULL_53_20]OGJ66572.1 MAG: hypothetical protein A3B61_01505 [Candidatus Peribacteria bacterium RIFCSPLOWO2_01_FULL_53_10]